jgi:hypothetical protein
MNWYKVFYWMSIADSVKLVFGTIAILTLIGLIASIVGYFISTTNVSDAARQGTPENQSTPYNEWMVWLKAWKRIFTASIITCFIASSL